MGAKLRFPSAPDVMESRAVVPLEDPAFLRAVLEAIPVFVLRTDPDDRINYINHLRGGFSLEQVVGRPARDLVAADDVEEYERAVRLARETGRPQSYRAKGTRNVNAAGRAHYECHAVPIDHGDGRRLDVCIVATDVSEHVAHAEALEQSEEKLRIAVAGTGMGLFRWDFETDRLECDRRLTEILGRTPATAAEYIQTIVHPDDRARMSLERESAADGRPMLPPHRVIRPDGTVRWVQACASVRTDEAGRPVGMLGGLLDVTAQRRAEEHLQRLQKLDAMLTLTAGMAHNLNNMLGVIVPALDLAAASVPAKYQRMMADAQHSMSRAAGLVHGLMAFARPSPALRIEPCDLSALVRRAVDMCRQTLEGDVQIEYLSPSDFPRVPCDAAAIEQVIVNLLINARDAMSTKPMGQRLIEVDLVRESRQRPDAVVRAAAPYARIRVRDNGTGVPEEVRQHLFEPFFTTKGPGRGTGLGLATSHRVVHDHGGFMMLEPGPVSGTDATVFLPLT